MLKLLLDEHISPEVAEGMRRRNKKAAVVPLIEWELGRSLGASDDTVLNEAAAQRLTLVTYDRRTIPPLLKLWAESGRDHDGVIFVDGKTIASSDIGGLGAALESLIREAGSWDWKNRLYFLRR